MVEKATPPEKVGTRAFLEADGAALAGTSALVIAAAWLGIAAIRGPLSLEAMAISMQRLPRFVWLVMAVGLGTLAAWAAFRGPRPLHERVVAGVAAIAGGVMAWAAAEPLPRAAFDVWERSLSQTSAGIPWMAVLALAFAAAIAVNFALVLGRVLRARELISMARLPIVLSAATLGALLIPASAILFFATGSRILPLGEPDDLWAPAFADTACPPSSGAPPGTSSRTAPSSASSAAPSSPPSAPKP